MNILILKNEFCICKVKTTHNIDFDNKYTFYAKTDDEISLVCDKAKIPGDATDIEDGYTAFKIDSVLDFSLVGIIAGISKILAENKISVFVVSTYNTDYIFIKSHAVQMAVELLSQNGYIFKTEH